MISDLESVYSKDKDAHRLSSLISLPCRVTSDICKVISPRLEVIRLNGSFIKYKFTGVKFENSFSSKQCWN